MQNDTLREMMVRVRDSKIVDRLDSLWNKYERLYTTQNQFIVDLLIRGIESAENELLNVKEVKASGNIFNELKRLANMLDRFVDVGYEHYKESFVITKENQTLISRLYDVIFRIAKEKGISIENYNKGIYDGLPDGFEEITDALLEDYKARENT